MLGPGGILRLYLAREQLTMGSRVLPLPGSGVLKKGYRLSKSEIKPSLWNVPDWLNPRRGGSGMTYHPAERWGDDGTVLSAARGQEFVAAPKSNSGAAEWLTALLLETM